MKKGKTFTIIALMAMISGSVSAAETALTVTLTDGNSATYLLSRKPRVSFSGKKMIISVPDASAEYPLSHIADISFRENLPSGISGIEEEIPIPHPLASRHPVLQQCAEFSARFLHPQFCAWRYPVGRSRFRQRPAA